MLLPVLILSFLIAVNADITCPGGYIDGGNNVCYKVNSTCTTRTNAARQCQHEGGHLATIPFAFINTLIHSEGSQDLLAGVWIGLECKNSSVTSCKFDDSASYLTPTSYANFAPGHPNPSLGQCVYLSTSGHYAGYWMSADCGSGFVCSPQNTYGFACEYTGVSGDICPPEYEEFNGMCYKAIAASDFTSAQQACKKDVAELTSVFSDEENEFIRSLALSAAPTSIFARIGLIMDTYDHFVWEDGTPFNVSQYSNFGMLNPNFGNCVAMALVNDAVPAGKWMNSRCGTTITSVCKRNKGSDPNVGPTLSPVKCDSPFYYNLNAVTHNATIYSPGFPNNYEANRCEYIISAPPLCYLVNITFTVFRLDAGAKIQLYNDIADSEPFQVLTPADVAANTTYASTENELKIIFVANDDAPGPQHYMWEADVEMTLAPDADPAKCP